MTFSLGAFYFLEKGKNFKSTILGFLASFTRSNGFLVSIPFLYQSFEKRNPLKLIQAFIVFSPYLIFNIIGYFYTGVFPVHTAALFSYWGETDFLLFQLFEIDQIYGVLFSIEFCLVFVPFILLFISKKKIVDVLSLGLKGNDVKTKYLGLSVAYLFMLLFQSNIANIHRYAIPILPLYWIYAQFWDKKPKIGKILLCLMISLLVIGTVLFSTWRLYW